VRSGGLLLLGAGHQFGKRDFKGRIESVERNDHGNLPLVIDAGYEIDASSAADHNAFNQCGDVHREYLSVRCVYGARRVNAARLGVIIVDRSFRVPRPAV